MSKNQLAAGVVAASAGNHAQGVALAAQHLSASATIVMPVTTPQIKVDAVRKRQARVIQHGDAYEDAWQRAVEEHLQKGLVLIPPYDDPEVIAGQATVATEIHNQHPAPLDAVFVPCGGGGLLAGMALWLNHVRPDLKVYGVEPDDAACLDLALRRGKRSRIKSVGKFADGAAVAMIGKETFRILKRPGCLAGVLTVSSDEICAAIKDIFHDTRSVAEPAGALALAGLKKYVAREQCSDQNLVAVHSGANINFDRLRYIVERTELGEEQEALFSVIIPEHPGSFLKFCELLGSHAITEFNYRYAGGDVARIFVGVSTQPGERFELQSRLHSAGYSVHDMSGDEMAKLHVRYMVGGRAGVADERIFRVQFAERPGALLDFLKQVGSQWNISLFHYRSHGAEYGRVLAGFQLPKHQCRDFVRTMRHYCLLCEEETDNQAYLDFLR